MSFHKDEYGFWRPWLIVAIILVVVSALGWAIAKGVTHLDRQSCATRATEMGLPYRHDMLAGCRVEVNGRYVPLDQLRIDTNGGTLGGGG